MTAAGLERLRGEFPGRRIDYYETVESTMPLAAALPVGSVVIAGEQTRGQGRHGHSWHSEAGLGLYFSVALQPHPVLTLALGIATVNAIAQVTGAACDIRWPNDVMLQGRKVAGILVQLTEGKAVAGIGINLNHSSFPPELEAISLKMHTGRDADGAELLRVLLPLIEQFQTEEKETILRLFAHESSYVAGRRVTVSLPDGEIAGVTAGLDPDGYLIVRKEDGTDTLILAGGVRAARS